MIFIQLDKKYVQLQSIGDPIFIVVFWLCNAYFFFSASKTFLQLYYIYINDIDHLYLDMGISCVKTPLPTSFDYIHDKKKSSHLWEVFECWLIDFTSIFVRFDDIIYFTQKKTSPLLMKVDFGLCSSLMGLIRKWILACLTCYDTKLRFTSSHPKDLISDTLCKIEKLLFNGVVDFFYLFYIFWKYST